MAQRNMVCTTQSIDLEPERGHIQVHPNEYQFGENGGDFPNRNAQLAVRVSANDASVGLSDFRTYYDTSIQNQRPQTCHPHLGNDAGFAFPSNVYSPAMPTSSSSRYIPVSHGFASSSPLPFPLSHQGIINSVDESSRNNIVGETSRGFIKRKNSELAAGNYHFVNGFAGSSSSSSHASHNPGVRQWGASFDMNGVPNLAVFNPPDYQMTGSWPAIEASSINGPSGYSPMALHPESGQHGSYVLPIRFMGQYIQPPSNAWVPPTGNSIVDGAPQWEYNNSMTNMQGRFASSASIDTNGGLQDYQNSSSSLSQGPLPYFPQHPVHHVPVHGLVDHSQMQVPYQQPPLNSVGFHGGSVNPSSNILRLGPRIPSFLPSGERGFGLPRHPVHVNSDVNHGVQILPPEHAALMDLSRLYEVATVIDEHRDMRLDIDSMSYEELLALEDQIGNVNTGLTERFITENLKARSYIPGPPTISAHLSESERDSCTICQEEYQEKERIGTLGCGHRYHVDCIKQWLLLKNSCPICKTAAFSAVRTCG